MEGKPPIAIVDIRGKTELKCPKCDLILPIPKRKIDMKTLRHMQEVKKFADFWKEKISSKNSDAKGLSNVILIPCPRCDQIIVCIDEFSIIEER
jgi:uncharacterized C2H2 Zn-finger protein